MQLALTNCTALYFIVSNFGCKVTAFSHLVQYLKIVILSACRIFRIIRFGQVFYELVGWCFDIEEINSEAYSKRLRVYTLHNSKKAVTAD